MISIIVCSRSAGLFDKFQKNIEITIGVAHEVIRVDNANSNYSICRAYNEGAEKAIFPFLCFVHEDVLFKTNNWGRNFLDHFSEVENLGLIGVAGAVYKSKMSCAWWQAEEGQEEIKRMNILQHSKNEDQPFTHLFINPLNKTIAEVVVIDGVFMGTTKAVWLNNKFDDQLLKSFHGYDLDFSFQIGQSKKIIVVYNILLQHFSVGTKNINWMFETIKVHQKWSIKLPSKTTTYHVDDSMLYNHSWHRLRKNIAALIYYKCGWKMLIKKYHQLFLLLDNKPAFPSLTKDYILGCIKMLRIFFRKKQTA